MSTSGLHVYHKENYKTSCCSLSSALKEHSKKLVIKKQLKTLVFANEFSKSDIETEVLQRFEKTSSY